MALPAERHHCRSHWIAQICGQLWAKCGHGRPGNDSGASRRANRHALLPGDLAVWDGHVAMVVDNGMTIEPMYQYGCRTTAVMPLPRPTPCVPRSQAFSPTVTCLYSAGLLAPTTGAA